MNQASVVTQAAQDVACEPQQYEGREQRESCEEHQQPQQREECQQQKECQQPQQREGREQHELRAQRQQILRQRIRNIVRIIILWNVVEAIIALAAGNVASSAALIGFGLDSIIEVLSAAAIAWQFRAPDPHTRERTALGLIAFSFFALAAYVSVDAILSILGLGDADHSLVGIILACVSLIVMPFLSWYERKTGRELGSASAVADSHQTLICAYLSAALLVGLLLNYLFDWSWADSVTALIIAAFAVREGINALRGRTCCSSAAATLSEETDEDECTSCR